MKFTVHCVIKNEDLWIWFAINSILEFADKVIIYDTGSTDKTVEIVKNINSPKIEFEEKGEVTPKGLVNLRQEQLSKTVTDWFLILDGDEVWKKSEIQKLLKATELSAANIKALFNRARNCIGDIYHYLPDTAGKYKIGNEEGNLNMRMIKKNNDLKIVGEYPLETYTDSDGALQIQTNNIQYVDCWYLHTTYLKRSSSDTKKTSGSFGKSKFPERGVEFKKNEIPEIFYQDKPDIVQNPLVKRSLLFKSVSVISTPILKLKRNNND